MKSAISYDSDNKCLYKGIADTADCLFSEHDKKGYKTYKVSIPNTPDEIIISSNLHYQGASYLFAQIKINGLSLLNLRDINALDCINHNELDTFQVSAGKWDELFDDVVKSYNNRCYISESDIESYFYKLASIISSEDILVYRNKTDQKLAKWEGTFLVMLHAIRIISNVIFCKDQSTLKDNVCFENKLVSICRCFMHRFADCFPTWKIRENDSRLKSISEGLLVIHNYINQHGTPVEFVRYFYPDYNQR